MSDDAPPVFDADVIAEVASAASVSESKLVAGLVAVQSVVAGFADLSVDDIVYEWRTRHHKDPLVSQTADAYYLDVREHVWDDLIERADVEAVDEEDIGAVIKDVHATQFSSDQDADAPAGAMVLVRA